MRKETAILGKSYFYFLLVHHVKALDLIALMVVMMYTFAIKKHT